MAKFIDLVLRAKDLFSPSSDKAAESISGLKVELKALDKELKEVETNQANVKAFEELSAQSTELNKALVETNSILDKYSKEQSQASSAAVIAQKNYDKLNIEAKLLEKTYREQSTALNKVTTSLNKANQQYGEGSAEVVKLTTSQKSFQDAVSKTEQSLESINQELGKQKQQQIETKQALDDTTRNYQSAAKAINKFETDLRNTNSQLSKVSTKLDQASIDTKNLSNASKSLADRQKELVRQFTDAAAKLGGLTAKLTGLRKGFNSVSTGVSGTVSSLVALAGTYIGVQGITRALTSFVSTGAQFETFRKQFEGITGSVAKGEVAFQWVQDFAKESPLDLAQTTQAFITLKGAGLDPMNGTLQAITDSTAKYTGSTEKLENITKQLSQAWGKAKITAEDMTNIVDNGLPVWDLLSQATGKNVSELRNLSEQGKLGRYELRLLFDAMRDDAIGASARLMSTFNGQLSVAIANFQQFLSTIAQSGALDYLKEQLTNLNKQASEMAANGELKKYAQEFSDAFVNMAKNGVASLKTLFTDLTGFFATLEKIGASFAIVTNVFTIGIRTIIGSFALLIKSVSYVQSQILSLFGTIPNAASKAALEVSKFADAMQDVATKQMQQDITELNAALDTFKNNSSTAGDSLTGLGNSVDNTVEKLTPLEIAMNLSGDAAKTMAERWLKLGDDLESSFSSTDEAKQNIDALISALERDPTPGSQRIVAQLKSVSDELGKTAKQSDVTVKTLGELEDAFRNTGGESLAKLKDNVASTIEVFNGFSEAKKPVSELRQAFLSQLDAQLALAKAQNDILLPSNLELIATQLGLTQEFNNASEELTNYNDKLSGLADITDRLAEKQERLKRTQKDGADQTEQQRIAQEELNKANAKAASHAGANAAFQKLWNEAKERSIRLYDLASASTEQLTEKTKELAETIFNLNFRASWSSILKPINDLNRAAAENELQAIAQTKAYQALFERLKEGKVSTKELNFFTREANGLFDKLDKTNLESLHNQINIARESSASLRDELVDTIHDLKNELDGLQGNQAAVLKRDYEAKKVELEAKLKNAQTSQDSNAITQAREALNIQKQIYDIKSKTTKQEQIQTTKTVSETNNTTTNIKETKQVIEHRYTVSFVAKGSSAQFTSTTGVGVEQLLKALAESGFTVTKS